jgi:hypothetical protein
MAEPPHEVDVEIPVVFVSSLVNQVEIPEN